MKDIDVSLYADYIKKLIANYISAKVLLVEDINKYIEQIGGTSDNCLPIAKALWNSKTEAPMILLQNKMSEDEIDSVLTTLFIKNLYDVYEIIKEPMDYITHTVLHEVAHIKHNWNQSDENKCDIWAFKQLELIKSGSI